MENNLDISKTTLFIMEKITELRSRPLDAENSILLDTEHFPFYDDVQRAFEEMGIESEALYTPVGGVDSEFDICFPLDGYRWQISGTLRYGYAHLYRFDKIEKGNFGYVE